MSKLLYVCLLSLGVLLAGCGGGYQEPISDESIVLDRVSGTVDGIGDDVAIPSGGLAGGDPGDLLSQRVVYFAYDSSALNADAQAIVQAHAAYLNSDVNAQIILEGHADERGTREYNLALADDRAKSVGAVMQAFGVTANRIEAVSYGEERPAVAGSGEEAWRFNRRVEIFYQ